MTTETALRELLQDCQLVDIVCRELSARLRTQGEPGPEDVDEGQATTDLAMGFDLEPQKLDFSFTVRVASADLEAMAEVVARYKVPVEELSEEVAVAFANRVAFFAAYPFLREVIHSLTSRLPGVSTVVLPVVQDPPGFVRTAELTDTPT